METFLNFNPLLLISVLGALACFAFLLSLFQYAEEKQDHKNIKQRLNANEHHKIIKDKQENKQQSKIPKKVRTLAQLFENISISLKLGGFKKIRLQLMQIGYTNADALGYYIIIRLMVALSAALIAIFSCSIFYSNNSVAFMICLVVVATTCGYFLPNLYISNRAKNIELENRQGFPDVIDLMIVSAEAGLTMEASIERISKEIHVTYPHVSEHLSIASLEIRAGKPISEAIRAFGERLKLEEVNGFATIIQQSKELGTSISNALRIYADEMRHKRMMLAEEKAYALPAKLSVPVTLFILPIVIGIAIMPVIIRMGFL